MIRKDEGFGFLLQYENVAWYEGGKVSILDRRIYPVETKYVVCTAHEEVAQAIADMVTQSGGPYTAAAMGMALAAFEAKDMKDTEYLPYMEKAAFTLSHARPTTTKAMERVTDRALEAVRNALQQGVEQQDIPDLLRDDAIARCNEKVEYYDRVAGFLAEKIPENGTIMTQCFAETIIGTLLRECRNTGKRISLICPETRPYYQGARLTASLACSMGFPTTVITDNMPAAVMKEKHVDLFTSAADVITMDGHVVNKVGTFQIALAARYWGIPYYATGAPDAGHSGIDSVHMEYRDPEQTLESLGKKHTLPGVQGLYPAFDITPPQLVTGIVTGKGIFRPEELKQYFL